jgi:carbon monoxide dehydrogenase subunit G
VWRYFVDVPAVATCVPGVESVEAVDARTFQGTMRLKVGPLGFRLSGRLVQQEVDEAGQTATLVVAAEDRALASAVSATMRLRLSQVPDGTSVTVETEANVRGKLGQFGQGVIKLAADGVLKQFAGCVQQKLARPAPAEA